MPSLKSIFLFAIAAFSTFTSAAPVADSGVASVDLVVRDLAVPTVDITERGLTTFPGIIADVTVKVNVVVGKLDVVVKAGGIINVKVLLGFIAEVKAILIAAVADIKAIVDVSIDSLLFDGTVVITISACAQLLFDLFVIIILFLFGCFKAAGLLAVALVLLAIVDIVLTIVAFLTAFFLLIVDLKVSFGLLLKADVHIQGILSILGILNIIDLLGIVL